MRIHGRFAMLALVLLLTACGDVVPSANAAPGDVAVEVEKENAAILSTEQLAGTYFVIRPGQPRHLAVIEIQPDGAMKVKQGHVAGEREPSRLEVVNAGEFAQFRWVLRDGAQTWYSGFQKTPLGNLRMVVDVANVPPSIDHESFIGDFILTLDRAEADRLAQANASPLGLEGIEY